MEELILGGLIVVSQVASVLYLKSIFKKRIIAKQAPAKAEPDGYELYQG